MVKSISRLLVKLGFTAVVGSSRCASAPSAARLLSQVVLKGTVSQKILLA